MRRSRVTPLRRRAVLQALAGGGIAGLAGCNRLGSDDLPISTTDGVTTETATLVPENRSQNDRFGQSVSVADGTVFIGAPYDGDPNGRWVGAAYVFERARDGWRARGKLTASDGDSFDRFGQSVAVDGDTALVASPNDETPNGQNAGAVYVFERGAQGWAQKAKFAPNTGDSGDTFGGSLALGGQTALVGAPTDEDPSGLYAGSASVFDGSGSNWRERATLSPREGAKQDSFGSSIDLSGDTAVVGASGVQSADGQASGAAYVFDRSGGEWSQRGRLTAEDGDGGDAFATSVAVTGDTAVVGAPQDEDPNGTNAGAAYVFGASGDGWTQMAKLVPENGDAEEFFGWSVAMANGVAFVSAPKANEPKGTRVGAVYVFTGGSDGWTQRALLAPADGNSGDRFGWAVAFGDGTAVVSALDTAGSSGKETGTAYVYE